MIGPADLTGVDETLARRLIATARSIAPCLDALVNEPRADAIAILLGVAAEVPAPGARRMKSQSRNGTSVGWADYSAAFTDEDKVALRALCSTASTVGAPVGSFPESTMACRIWPSEVYP